jgi:hypothetical protein
MVEKRISRKDVLASKVMKKRTQGHPQGQEGPDAGWENRPLVRLEDAEAMVTGGYGHE